MQLVPSVLTDLFSSKKAVNLYLLVALWVPAVHNTMGLDFESMKWITIAFIGYVIAQGLKDFGTAAQSGDLSDK